MMTNLLGISAFYGEGHNGHYDSVPRALLEHASKSGDDKLVFVGPGLNSNLGLLKSACSTLRRLQSPYEIFFTEQKSQIVVDFISTQILQHSPSGVFVYEGHILWLSVFEKLALRFPKISFLLNMHHADFMMVGGESLLTRKLITDLLAGTSKFENLGVTFESEILHEKFKDDRYEGLGTFPVVSDISPAKKRHLARHGTLVSFSGITRKNVHTILSLTELLGLGGSDLLLFRPPDLIKNRLPREKKIEGELSKEQYARIFCSVEEVWFFPLLKINYFGSSGRLADAISANATPVVPRGSALHDFCREHASDYAVYDFRIDGSELAIEKLIGDNNPTGPRESLQRIVQLCLQIGERHERGAGRASVKVWFVVMTILIVRIRARFLKTLFKDVTTVPLKTILKQPRL